MPSDWLLNHSKKRDQGSCCPLSPFCYYIEIPWQLQQRKKKKTRLSLYLIVHIRPGNNPPLPFSLSLMMQKKSELPCVIHSSINTTKHGYRSTSEWYRFTGHHRIIWLETCAAASIQVSALLIPPCIYLLYPEWWNAAAGKYNWGGGVADPTFDPLKFPFSFNRRTRKRARRTALGLYPCTARTLPGSHVEKDVE